MPSRRDLLLGAAAGLALAGCGDDDEKARPARGLGAGDLSVVALAHMLEVVERDLYAAVVRSGRLRGDERRLARVFGEQEAEHAEVLEGVLRRTSTPLAAPPDADLERLAARERPVVLRLLADIEDVGAATYLGAAPEVLDREALALALSIHSVEARHAAFWRRRLGLRPSGEGAFAAPVTPGEARQRLGVLLSGGTVT